MKKLLSVTFIVAFVLALFPMSVSAAGAPELSAQAAILCAVSDDGKYDLVLYEKNADEKMYPASLTKIMTAIVALEFEGNLDTELIAYKKVIDDYKDAGHKVEFAIEGEKFTYQDALNMMLVYSNNEIADIIAHNVAGSVESFVEMMNEKAAELGCTNTHFANAHGLHDDDHYTTARDMLIISRYAMQNEIFAEIVAQSSIKQPITNKKLHQEDKTLGTKNQFLIKSNKYRVKVSTGSGESKYIDCSEHILGIKTGSTTPAGNCLSSALAYEGMTYYSVVMGCPESSNRYTDSIELFEYGITGFEERPLFEATELITEIPVTLSSDGTSVILLPEKTVTDFVPVGDITVYTRADGEEFPEDFDPTGKVILTYTVPESVEAPIEKGQAIGTLKVEFEGREICTMNLLSSLTLSKSEVLDTVSSFKAFIQSNLFKYIVIGIVALIVVLIVVVIVTARNRRKKRRKYGRGRYSR